MPESLPFKDRFGDVPIPVEVRIGFRKTTVREVVGLTSGSIVLLDRPAGETLDLMIGGFRLATVEVVVVEDALAVRITELHISRPVSAQDH